MPSPHFGEQHLELRVAPQVSALINAPAPDAYSPHRPTHFVFYALPNGNTLGQTLGCTERDGLDWHYAIQHVGAQIRRLRAMAPHENWILLLLTCDQRSWPAWRAAHADNAARIRALVGDLVRLVPHREDAFDIVLTGHSGGGSFLTGFLNGGDEIPPAVTRIAYLDSNYSYSDEDRHGDKLINWLRANPANQLVVLAYDDREIVLNGKKVVGPTGGTYRATERMKARFAQDFSLAEGRRGAFHEWTAAPRGRAIFLTHPNPENAILHTRLVGDMSGLLFALAWNTSAEDRWGAFGQADSYRPWIQAAPYDDAVAQPACQFPSRPADALPASALVAALVALPAEIQQTRLAGELLRGNVPTAARSMQSVLIAGANGAGSRRSLVVHVSVDYVSVGDDDDAMRTPLTPAAAQRVADAVDAILPTPRIVDAIHAAAELRLDPIPLTENRSTLATFLKHDRLIEQQRTPPPSTPGTTSQQSAAPPSRVDGLISGMKKDVVLTQRLAAAPGRVAIYGWQRSDGTNIQPLYTGHAATYVDYSHGVRLVARDAMLDGAAVRLDELLADPILAPLVSDEGPLTVTRTAP